MDNNPCSTSTNTLLIALAFEAAIVFLIIYTIGKNGEDYVGILLVYFGILLFLWAKKSAVSWLSYFIMKKDIIELIHKSYVDVKMPDPSVIGTTTPDDYYELVYCDNEYCTEKRMLARLHHYELGMLRSHGQFQSLFRAISIYKKALKKLRIYYLKNPISA